MKKALSLIFVVLIIVTTIVGCGNKIITTDSTTEVPTTSEIDLQYEAGNAFLKKQEYEKAIAAFDKVIEMDETRTDVYLLRGNAYYELAQTDNVVDNLLFAVKDYEFAVNKKVATKDTKLYRCYVELGENAVDNGKKYEALQYYEKAYELDKSDPYVALMQRQYMFKISEEPYYTYFVFDFDNTGFAVQNTVIEDETAVEYELIGNSVVINNQNTKYTWEYDSNKGKFEWNNTTVEIVDAKDAFDNFYSITGEIISTAEVGNTQMEMTKNAYWQYNSWDNLLNVVYFYLIDMIPEDEASALSTAQIEWIKDKEAYMVSESAIYEGGSMQSMVKGHAGAYYTQDRVKELITMLP